MLGSLPFITLKNGILDWVLDREVTRHKIATVNIFGARILLINDFHLAKVLLFLHLQGGSNISKL